jgi:hypothetical protein
MGTPAAESAARPSAVKEATAAGARAVARLFDGAEAESGGVGVVVNAAGRIDHHDLDVGTPPGGVSPACRRP